MHGQDENNYISVEDAENARLKLARLEFAAQTRSAMQR